MCSPSSYGLTHFYGAKLVATLYDLKIPALLVTQYVDIDNDVSIRKWRDKVPVLLSRDETNADSIQRGITNCVSELRGQVSSSRKPHRTLLRVINVTNESNYNFACHAFTSDPSDLSVLRVSSRFEITMRDFHARRFAVPHHPFIILNACRTGIRSS